jgi:3-dehydroquinate synthase
LLLDPNVDRLYGQIIRAYFAAHRIEYVPLMLEQRQQNEANKSIEIYTALISELMHHGPSADDLLVSIGGGVTSDLGGFIAGTLRRGLSFVAVATTLIAQIDSAISLKTAVNIGPWKNAAGVFYPREAVLCDPTMLATLDRGSLLGGIAELVKLAIVRSSELFTILEHYGRELVDHAFQGKQALELLWWCGRLWVAVKWDGPYPGNRPASIRSFGHSFSRELEGASNYDLSHGDAVSVEMTCATYLSERMKILPGSERVRILRLFSTLGLCQHASPCEIETVWGVFKRRFALNRPFLFPIPGHRIGAGRFLSRFTKADLVAAIEQARTSAGDHWQQTD